jgi:hypothetical protein
MVSGANVSCACKRSPNGIAPFCHLGDGCVDVLIIKHTHMLNNLKLLLRFSSKEKNVVCSFLYHLRISISVAVNSELMFSIGKHSLHETLQKVTCRLKCPFGILSFWTLTTIDSRIPLRKLVNLSVKGIMRSYGIGLSVFSFLYIF